MSWRVSAFGELLIFIIRALVASRDTGGIRAHAIPENDKNDDNVFRCLTTASSSACPTVCSSLCIETDRLCTDTAVVELSCPHNLGLIFRLHGLGCVSIVLSVHRKILRPIE